MQEVYDYFAARGDEMVDELLELVAIPSVSTDSRHKQDVLRAANWLAEKLRQAGPLEVQIHQTAQHPIVYAEWLGAPGAPTILVYGHYDVQPPDPLEKWQTPPFEPHLRHGRIYARGVSDDKGPLFIAVKVAEAFFASTGKLPINVKLLFEGEEEIGSPNLETFVQENARRLKADFMLSADGGMWRADIPSVTVSSRGLAALEFTVRGPAKDLHSGRYGGAVANPLHAMASLIASLHTEDGRVTVAGFYDDIKAQSEEERQLTQSLPFDEEAYLTEVGSAAPYGEAGYSTLERLWNRPTLEVNGMWGGYQGEGSKTVLPSEAHAKITCRLVADQEPHDIREKLIRHLEQHKPTGVRLEIHPDEHGASAYRLSLEHPGIHTARQVLREVYGQEPLIVGMGGSVPICESFRRLLSMDTVFFSFAVGDEDIHAPNEFFRLERFHQGLRAWALFWQTLSETSS